MPALSRIRPARPEDVEALVEARVLMFRELGQTLDPEAERTFRNDCRAALEPLLAGDRARAWLALGEQGDIQGATILLEFPRLPSPSNRGAREGYALNVYVVPAARRRGVARMLVEAAIAEARRRGLARIRLHATPAGRSVYRRLGFTERTDEMELVL